MEELLPEQHREDNKDAHSHVKAENALPGHTSKDLKAEELEQIIVHPRS